jgi:hypothetical protein
MARRQRVGRRNPGWSEAGGCGSLAARVGVKRPGRGTGL